MKKILIGAIILLGFALIGPLYSQKTNRVKKQNQEVGKSLTKIVKLSKQIDTAHWYYKLNHTSLDNWKLSKDQALLILKQSTPVSSTKLHDFYDVLPCQYNGIAITNKRDTISFEINAGAYSVIFLKDTFLYLGFEKEKKYFITYPSKD